MTADATAADATPACRTGHRGTAGQGAARTGAGVVRRRDRRPGEARHRARSRRRQAAVHAAPPRGAAARRRQRTTRTVLGSARPLPQHRARRRRPADPGAAGLRAEGRRRMDVAGTHQRQQGRALRPSRGEARRADRRRCCRRSCARRSRRCRSRSRCAGATTTTASPVPLHWLVLLLGNDVVDGEVFGMPAGRNSRGHRFHHDKPVWIGTPGDYVDALRGAKVLVDPDERRARIVREVERPRPRDGGVARIADDNLEAGQLPGRMAERGRLRFRGRRSSPCRRKRWSRPWKPTRSSSRCSTPPAS